MNRFAIAGRSRPLLLAAAGTGASAAPAHRTARYARVSLLPSPGKAELVIGRAAARSRSRDFVLADPDRIVLDLTGATLADAGRAGLRRREARPASSTCGYASTRPDVVRVVLDLDGDQALHGAGSTERAIRVYLRRRRALPGLVLGRGRRPAGAAAAAAAPARRGGRRRPARRRAEVRRGRCAGRRGQRAPDHGHLGQGQHRRRRRRASRPSAAGPSSWARTSRARSPPRSGTSRGRRRSRRFSPRRACRPRRCRAASSGSMRRPRSPSSTRWSRWRRSVVRVNYARAGELAKSIEGHPDQEPRQGRRRHRDQLADHHRHQVAPSTSIVDFVTRARHPDAAGLDPGQDHLRGPDRPRAARLQVRPRHQQPVLQQADPASRSAARRPARTIPNINVVDLGGNAVSAIANADADHPALGASTWSSRPRSAASRSPAFLTALERVELSDVQAEPIITTLDNKKADILVGEEIPVRVIDASASGGARASRRAPRVQFKETGIRLTVTPHVTNNRQILMDLDDRAVRRPAAGGRATSASSSPSRQPRTSSWWPTARPRSSAASRSPRCNRPGSASRSCRASR